jgi:hypothetical protein
MKLSRRALARIALAASAPAQAQTEAPRAAMDLEQAHREVELTAELLRKREIPMSTEPAFHFKA